MTSFDRIETQLREKGWKKAEMMRRLGIDYTNYAKWKHMGYIPDKYYARLADILEVDEAYLRGHTDDPRGETRPILYMPPFPQASAASSSPRRHPAGLRQQSDLLPSRAAKDLRFAPYPGAEEGATQEKVDRKRLTDTALLVAHAFDTSDRRTQEIILKILDIEG